MQEKKQQHTSEWLYATTLLERNPELIYNVLLHIQSECGFPLLKQPIEVEKIRSTVWAIDYCLKFLGKSCPPTTPTIDKLKIVIDNFRSGKFSQSSIIWLISKNDLALQPVFLYDQEAQRNIGPRVFPSQESALSYIKFHHKKCFPWPLRIKTFHRWGRTINKPSDNGEGKYLACVHAPDGDLIMICPIRKTTLELIGFDGCCKPIKQQQQEIEHSHSPILFTARAMQRQ